MSPGFSMISRDLADSLELHLGVSALTGVLWMEMAMCFLYNW